MVVAVVRPTVSSEGGGDSSLDEEPSAERTDETGGDVDFNGRWDITHEIQVSRLSAYAGLRLGYRLTLQQERGRVYGRGVKVSENGVALPEERRTPIFVDGRVEGGSLVLHFVEHGSERSSTGTIRWQLSPGGDALQGRFSSDVAQSSGTSVAHRLR